MCESSGKKAKAQGWEEAGSEFYQESYNSEWDGALKDKTAAITTLLPSKQNRFGTCRRPQTGVQEYKTTKVKHPIASSSHTTQKQNESHFCALPDLSQVLTDEERIWEEMLLIKMMPVPMTQKKSFKANLQNTTKLRLQGFNQFKWKHRKAWQKIRLYWSEFTSKTELWHSPLKQIEGYFGTGVVAYFLFLRWLFFLNCISFFLILMFVVLPNISLYSDYENSKKNCTLPETEEKDSCLQVNVDDAIGINLILDIIQGSGFMQSSLMFYGAYSNETLSSAKTINKQLHSVNNTDSNISIFDGGWYYNLPLAYVCVMISYFLVVLVAIVRAAACELRDRLIDGKWQFYQYCNLIFGGWDFCIHNEKSADIKHKAVFNEMISILHSKRIQMERKNRSSDLMYKLVFVRILINIVVLNILMVSAYFIYFLFSLSVHQNNPVSFTELSTLKSQDMPTFNNTEVRNSNSNVRNLNNLYSSNVISYSFDNTEQQILKLVIDFVPFIGIVCLNLLVPNIFNYLCSFEKYSPLFVVRITLFRTIFLRLASLGVLLSRFYFIVIPKQNYNFLYNSVTYSCWENFVGQQFHKLVVTDFVCHLLVTFFINFPRAVCARRVNNKIVRFIGEQEFELSKHVLDIVYIQTISWLGSFYSPLLPAIVAVIIFLMFYVKKFQCMVNSKPSKIFYGTSRSNSLFMFILLLSFFVAIVPVTYAIAEIHPSPHCGPFRDFKTVWSAPLAAFMKLPEVVKSFLFFFSTAGFAIPCFIVLTLLLYYFYAVSDANKNMVEVLRNQLVLEGHDKQFLLTRLSAFLKQQEVTRSAHTRNDAAN